jgi:two-component system, NtrC family, sensor kinase
MENADPKTVLGHLSSAVGHHVINAFSTIVSQGEILRSLTGPWEQEPGEFHDRIEAMIQTALDASVLTRRLIEISHGLTTVETGQSAGPPEEIHLDRLVAAALEERREKMEGNVSLVLNLAPTPPIYGQAGPLRLMLDSLLQNAWESLPQNAGTIGVSTVVDDRDWIVLEIRDSGGGMTEEVLERAVEPFFSTKPDHLGIGLTVAKGIWRRHRGTLMIDSQPGRGTTVRLSVAATGH